MQAAEEIDHHVSGRSVASMQSAASFSSSRKPPSHASGRTSTTDTSLYLQGRTKDGDHAEMTPFLNEEKLQFERIIAARIQRTLSRGKFLQADPGIRGFCYRLLQNAGVQVLCNLAAGLTLLLVLIHANVAAGALRNPEDANLQAVSEGIDGVMKVLIGLYIVEVVIRVLGCPVKPFYNDGWLVLDMIISTIAFSDEFVLEHFKSLGILRSTRAVRMLRILRVGRIFSVMASIREYPLVAQVVSETVARLGWMLVIWSTIGWCTAVMLTVVVGAAGSTDMPTIEDPLMEAIVSAGPAYPLQIEQLLQGMGGSLLVLNMIPLQLVYWGPGMIWKLLLADSTRFNVAGGIILTYAAFCLCWLWPMVLGTFISALREGNSKHQSKKVAEARAAAEMNVTDLIDMFEDVVGKSKERFISMDDFRELQYRHPAFRQLLSGGQKGRVGASYADVIFREIDVMGHNFLTLPDFVVGVLKLFRVTPRPEFMHTDEQQRRALKTFKKVADSNRFSFLVTNRYLSEFSRLLTTLVQASSSMLRAEVRSPRSAEPPQTLAAVDREEDAAIRRWFRNKMQEDRKVISRLDDLERRIENLRARTLPAEDKLREAFSKVTHKIMQEDVLPWMRTAIPQHCMSLSLKIQRHEQMQRSTAAAAAPAGPKTGEQEGQVTMESPPSPDSPQRRGFRLTESLREAGEEFGWPMPPKSELARRS